MKGQFLFIVPAVGMLCLAGGLWWHDQEQSRQAARAALVAAMDAEQATKAREAARRAVGAVLGAEKAARRTRRARGGGGSGIYVARIRNIDPAPTPDDFRAAWSAYLAACEAHQAAERQAAGKLLVSIGAAVAGHPAGALGALPAGEPDGRPAAWSRLQTIAAGYGVTPAPAAP